MSQDTVTAIPTIQISLLPPKGGQGNASMPLKWAVSPELAQYLLDNRAVSPYLLVVISNKGKETARYVFPLKELERYITFTHSGKNVVQATVVWRNGTDGKDPAKALLKKENGRYDWDVLHPEFPEKDAVEEQIYKIRSQIHDVAAANSKTANKPVQEASSELDIKLAELEELARHLQNTEIPVTKLVVWSYSIVFLASEAKVEIDVDPSFFSQKNHRIIEWFGNLYPWETRAFDECHTRKRALFTLATIIPVGIFIAFRLCIRLLVALVVIVSGMRNPQLKSLILMREPISRIWRNLRPSRWYSNETKNGEGNYSWYSYEPRRPLAFVFAPSTLIVLAIITWALYGIFGKIGILMPTLLLVAAIIVATILTLVGGQISSYINRRSSESAIARSAKAAHQLAGLDIELSQLVSTSGTGDEPKPSLALKFETLKARVCKPYEN